MKDTVTNGLRLRAEEQNGSRSIPPSLGDLIRIALLLLTILCASPAQEESQPSPAGSGDSTEIKSTPARNMPVIDLPEFVIMGTENVSFGEIQKQLIDLYSSDLFTERTGIGVREISLAPVSPTSTARLLLPPAGPRYHGLLKAGTGRFLSSTIDGWYGRKFPVGDILIHAGYGYARRFEGYPGLERADIDIGGGSFIHPGSDPLLARSRVEGEFGFTHRGYPFGRWSSGARAFAVPGDWLFGRTVRTIRYGGGLVSRDNPFLDHSVRLFAAHTIVTHADLVFQPEGFQTSVQENVFGAAVTAGKRFARISLTGELLAALYTNSAEPEYGPLHEPLYVRLGLSAAASLDPRLGLSGSLHSYLYRGNTGATSFRLFPSFRVDYAFAPEFNAWLAFQPRVEQSTLRDQLDRNPFLYDLRHVHRENRIDLSLGGEYRIDQGLHFTGSARYQQVAAYPLDRLMRSGTGLDSLFDRFGTITAGTTDIFSVSASAMKDFTPHDRLEAECTLRSSRNDFTGTQATLLPNFTFDARYTRSFSFPLIIGAEMRLIGERRGSVLPEITLPSVLVFSFEAEYRLLPPLGLFARVSNLFDDEYQYWAGYRAPPFMILAGASYRF